MSSLVGNLACCVNSVPHASMPDLAEYEAWIDSLPVAQRGCAKISASIYRRAAQLRRLHDTWAEIGRCVGVTPNGIRQAWDRLLERLR